MVGGVTSRASIFLRPRATRGSWSKVAIEMRSIPIPRPKVSRPRQPSRRTVTCDHYPICHRWRGGGGAYSFVACLSHLTIDDASLLRRSTVPTPNRDTSNIWALITLFPCIAHKLFAYSIPVLFYCRLRPVTGGAPGKLLCRRQASNVLRSLLSLW